MEKEKLERIGNYIENIYSVCEKDTAYPACRDEWTEKNRFLGHCAIVTALIHKNFGGDIKRGVLVAEKISHYWNFIDDMDIDATSMQFEEMPEIEGESIVSIDRIIGDDDTRNRLNLLEGRLDSVLDCDCAER